MLTREKQSAKTPNPKAETTALRGTGEDILYPQGFTSPCETQATYALPSQPFSFNYRPPQVVNTPGLVIREPKTGTDPVDPLAVPDLDELLEKGKSPQDEALKKYELLEERMRVIKRISISGSMDTVELSLIPGLVIPHKFKTLTFDKYEDTKCPITHLTMYCRKFFAYTNNDKLLIYCFQDSLTGIATQWYLKLDRTYI